MIKKKIKEIIVVVLTFILLLLTGHEILTPDYVVVGSEFYCYNCTDCTNALNNNTYSIVKLNQSISNQVGSCVNFPEDNKTFDCQGYTIDGDDSGTDYGVGLISKNNNTIQNCIVTDFKFGVFMQTAYNNTVQNSTLNSNEYGLDMNSCIDNLIYDNSLCSNTIKDIRDSAVLSSGYNNTCNTTTGWDDDGTTGCTWDCNSQANCNCTTCDKCEQFINDATCTTVYLIVDIIDHVGYCIDDPGNFNNKIFDGQEHTIDGNGSGVGIYLESKSNNTIKNHIITDFYHGIHLHVTSLNNTITNNIINNTVSNGVIFASTAKNNTLNNNTICNSGTYDIDDNDDNSGDDNTCDTTLNWNDTGTTDCTYACNGDCNCDSCDDCEARLNDATCSIVKLGSNISNESTSCINDPAGFNNKTFDCQGYNIDGDRGGSSFGIILEEQSNNTIRNCNITEFWYDGIYLYSSSNNNTIINNTLNYNDHGVKIGLNSSNNIITNNNLSNNYYGIWLYGNSSNNTITNNTVNNNQYYGLYVSHLESMNNNITDNTFCDNNQNQSTYVDVFNNATSIYFSNNICTFVYNLTCIEFCPDFIFRGYNWSVWDGSGWIPYPNTSLYWGYRSIGWQQQPRYQDFRNSQCIWNVTNLNQSCNISRIYFTQNETLTGLTFKIDDDIMYFNSSNLSTSPTQFNISLDYGEGQDFCLWVDSYFPSSSYDPSFNVSFGGYCRR